MRMGRCEGEGEVGELRMTEAFIQIDGQDVLFSAEASAGP